MDSEFVRRNKDIIVKDISSLGGNVFYLIVLAFFFLKQDYGIFTDLLVGVAIILLVSIIVRLVFFKERPERYRYTSLIEKVDAASFPSLHASRVSFLGIYFASLLNSNLLTGLFIAIALLVCYSRIYFRRHDTKDLGAGAILGIAVYYLVGLLN